MVNSANCINKRILFIIALVGVFAILFLGCGPDQFNPSVVCLEENCKIYRDSKHVATVTYNSYSDEEIEDSIDEVLLIETVTIEPLVPIELTIDDFLLGIGYEFYDNDSDRYHTSIEYNILKNQYDIFENAVITEAVTYSFCFVVPREKNGTLYTQVGVRLLVFHNYYLLNFFRSSFR